jgi:AcrR family transcriptional regulator
MKKRKYILKRRADQQQQTRERIVDAAMALHEELGPAATTISALAERAGVQRLTVYRHFENDEELFGACTSKWLDLHPPPDLSKFENENPEERTHTFLLALFRYYRQTEKMWSGSYRDIEKVPALREPMKGFDSYLAGVAKELAADWASRTPKLLRATLGHAVRFATWRSLADQRLSNKAMADLVCTWARATSEQV